MSPVVLRTSKMMFALVGGILGAGFVLGVLIVITRASAAWPPTIILGCLLAAAMSVLLSTKLALTGDTIHYRSLLVRTDVPLADIIRTKFVTGFSGCKPYQRLVVTVREKSSQRNIIINTGLFDPAQIRRWVAALDARRSSLATARHPGDEGFSQRADAR